jgi:hypothetical protein
VLWSHDTVIPCRISAVHLRASQIIADTTLTLVPYHLLVLALVGVTMRCAYAFGVTSAC